MIEADFHYFMSQSDEIKHDNLIDFTHQRNAKACGCGTLDIYLEVEHNIILDASFAGSLSVPNQVIMDDICGMIIGEYIDNVAAMNFAKGLDYTLPYTYQKCFHSFILRTLTNLLEEIRAESDSNNPKA